MVPADGAAPPYLGSEPSALAVVLRGRIMSYSMTICTNNITLLNLSPNRLNRKSLRSHPRNVALLVSFMVEIKDEIGILYSTVHAPRLLLNLLNLKSYRSPILSIANQIPFPVTAVIFTVPLLPVSRASLSIHTTFYHEMVPPERFALSPVSLRGSYASITPRRQMEPAGFFIPFGPAGGASIWWSRRELNPKLLLRREP